jgi:hypothetical protein
LVGLREEVEQAMLVVIGARGQHLSGELMTKIEFEIEGKLLNLSDEYPKYNNHATKLRLTCFDTLFH